MELANSSQKVALYGAGMLGAFFGTLLVENITYFIDDDPKLTGTEFMGKPVFNFLGRPDNVPVVNALPSCTPEK